MTTGEASWPRQRAGRELTRNALRSKQPQPCGIEASQAKAGQRTALCRKVAVDKRSGDFNQP